MKAFSMYRFSAIFVASFFLLAGTASAIPFDVTTVGGIATVGTAGDYSTLNAAASAFNALPAPYLQGHWNLVLLEDLTEPNNSGFGNTIPVGSSLTLKPAVDTNCVITFTTTTANPGPSGNLIIGCSAPFEWANLKSTDNFIIDGSNGGTSTALTIRNSASVGHDNSTPVSVAGDSDNFVIKNVIVENIGGSAGPNGNPVAVAGISRYDGISLLHPDNMKVQNSNLVCTIGRSHGVRFWVSDGQLAPAGLPGVVGFEISGCNIQSRLRGVVLETGINGTIDNNRFNIGSVGNSVTGQLQEGISADSPVWGGVSGTLNVSRNQIFMLSGNREAGDFGAVAFQSYASSPLNVINFVNNMVNFRFSPSPQASGKQMTYASFRAWGAAHYNVYHNSVNMSHFSALDTLAPNGIGTASIIKLPEANNYTANIESNIFRLDQENAAVFNLVTSLPIPPVVTSKNNVIFRSKATCFTAVTGPIASATSFLTLADWQATLQDIGSVSVDPVGTAGSKWVLTNSSADLHFVPADVRPTGLSTFAALPSVNVDYDGQGRSTDSTIPGADEVFKANVYEWAVY